MLSLIVLIIFGLSFAFVATQNTEIGTFHLLGYNWALPMYIIVFGALLIGFLISWIVSSISALGTWSHLHSKDKKIYESQQAVAGLQSRIRQLELENAKLQGRDEVPQKETITDKPANENKQHNFLDRFRKNHAY